jgi:hypothetical protein
MENAMTPQERQLIDDLFDRLAKLEGTPRDGEAMSAIMQGLRNAPHAVYALVQTALVQDEALKRANDRIQELEAGHTGEQNQSGGFLDSMRDAIFGQNQPRGSVPQGSVPNVRAPGMGGRPVWNSGEVMQQTQGSAQAPGQFGQAPYGQPAYGQPYGAPPPLGGGGGSFLGTAAAAAAGMVGGSLLLGSIRSMMGGGHQQSFGDTAGYGGGIEDRRPAGDQSSSDLARDAGINDIGSSGNSRAGLFDNSNSDDSSRAGFFDSASNDDDMDHDADGFDDDGGGSDDV